ncbi:CMGC/CDK/CDC2 protein kinase [Penicillium antarcticum]|uniref:CMGC/CDK/CDC2 protein kinase n=1 Tax=Penicillium antarcticum TaxID=416450 RepID=UPI00239DDF30|nr:CMGC/CDK/CDC2 protein kinase [Penicillium antarcticum]KAJ5301892.1 CMGC/CDK/CDC2 protein kinase [Penicillium antarcticum]
MNGIAITPSKLAKLLGVIFDHELRQKEYVQQHLRPEQMRQLYKACVAPVVEYASTVWHDPLRDKMHLRHLRTVQRAALIRIFSAFRTVATSTLKVEAHVLPTHIRLRHRAQTTIAKLRTLPGKHPDLNIVQLLDIVYADGHNFYLVIKFLDLDFKKYIEALPVSEGGRGKPLPDESTSMATLGLGDNIVKKFMAQLVEGTRYYYSHCILHCDLKPQNLLFGRDGNLKLADFGLARAFGVPLRTCTYESVDASFAEIYNCKPLFPSDSDIDEIFKILR